ncbi:MAG: septum site-determining protein Ssd [Mycobacteriales bacterium]
MPDRRARADRCPSVLVTGQSSLAVEVTRLAAAAGHEIDVAATAGAACRSWTGAPVVLVGADCARAVADLGLTRRPGLLVLATDAADSDVWRWAVAAGAEDVLFLPGAEQQLVDRLAEAADTAAGRSAAVLAAVGGRGGAGATVLAAGLAVTAIGRGLRTTLVDADPLGGGIDLVIGAEDRPGLRWPDLAGARGRVPAGALAEALPGVGELTVVSWDRGEVRHVPLPAMYAVLDAAVRGSDLVVVDLPRHLDDAARAALARTHLALVVVPAELRAAASAGRVVATLVRDCGDVRVVVRGPAPGGLPAHRVAEALGLPLAAVLRPEPGLPAALERGEAPARRGSGPLASACRALLAELARAGHLAA